MSSFFFNDTPSTAIYTLSLHDALPISTCRRRRRAGRAREGKNGSDDARRWTSATPLGKRRRGLLRCALCKARRIHTIDRKSTRLNSSHMSISYAVFCLKKKNNKRYYTV